MTAVAPSTTRRAGASSRPSPPGARAPGARAPGGAETRVRTAAAVLLVLGGLGAALAVWLGLAWGAWAAGWPWLAAPAGLLGLLTLLLLGGALRALPAVARPRRL